MYEMIELTEEPLSPTSTETYPDWETYKPVKQETIVIRDGWYKDGREGLAFEVKIYMNEGTGKYCALVPIFVQNPPENWVRIE
jgi:hypothetical protein